MSDGCGGDAQGGAVMNSVKPGDRVGVICIDGVVFGHVEKISNHRLTEVYCGNVRFCGYVKKFETKRVFPVWNESYTKRDVLFLSGVFDGWDETDIADDLRNFHHLNARATIELCKEITRQRESMVVNGDFNAVKDIDKFLDWAAHGFQSGVEQ